jgi:hypothetical protein
MLSRDGMEAVSQVVDAAEEIEMDARPGAAYRTG